ncbi:hypothetical protein K469DRAFT_539515, partial [Zopfia rhizophila CBS 207.26]
TTTPTMQRRKDGISWEHLPRTFQDAIWVSRQLDIADIWIDSLCIIQDDPDDCAKGSARMCEVFQFVHLTIAASSSSRHPDGFLNGYHKG